MVKRRATREVSSKRFLRKGGKVKMNADGKRDENRTDKWAETRKRADGVQQKGWRGLERERGGKGLGGAKERERPVRGVAIGVV
jgi:hypothetical protein